MTFSTADPLRSPEAERVSFTDTFRAPNRAYAMFTIMADFRWMSRCRLPADKNDVICSSMLSWILGVCSGKHIANSWSAELTTSVAGGFGRLNGSFDFLMYNEIESCSRALHMGERSCGN